MATLGGQASGRAAFQYPGFLVFQVARFFVVLATEMQSVAVGWQVYELTKRSFDLGYVGLAQFLPGIALFLVSGQVADRFSRTKVVFFCFLGYTVCSTLLFLMAFHR